MINGKKSLFYTVLMAGALMSCGGPKQASKRRGSEEW